MATVSLTDKASSSIYSLQAHGGEVWRNSGTLRGMKILKNSHIDLDNICER